MQTLEHIRRLSDERFLAMYESMSQQGFGPLDAEVAKRMKFRPQAIRKLPIALRAKQAKALLLATKNAELAYEFLGTYLLKERKGLVTGFLEATGVAHEDGMIDEQPGNLPDAEKVAPAVKDLDQRFEKDDVTAYLAIAAQQWPEVRTIEPLWRARLG